MISPNNATRVLLNEEARARLKRDRVLAQRGIVIGGQEFCVGERVIARRNDRYRDVDNGTRATITTIDDLAGILVVAVMLVVSPCVVKAILDHLQSRTSSDLGEARRRRRAGSRSSTWRATGPE